MQAHVADAARAWEAMGRDPGELYRGARLAAVLESPVADLNPTEQAFIEESSRSRRTRTRRARSDESPPAHAPCRRSDRVRPRAHRRRRRVRPAAAAHARAATRATVSKLAAQSREVSQTKPDLGLLLAVEANRHQDSVESRGAILSAIATHPSLKTQLYGVTSNVGSLAFSPDGKLLAAVSNVETIFYDTATNTTVGPVIQAEGRRWWGGTLHERRPAVPRSRTIPATSRSGTSRRASASARSAASTGSRSPPSD